MKRLFFIMNSLLVISFLGCAPGAGPPRGQSLSVQDRSADDPFAGLRSYPVEDSTTNQATPRQRTEGDLTVVDSEADPSVRPFHCEGTFIPSGWMGDAERADGPLKYEVCVENPSSAPTCDKWTYASPQGVEKSWVAVAYQSPADNFGNARGLDFRGKGLTRLTFMARGEVGGEILLVKSGGCTSPGARYPASYEKTIGTIVLEAEWKQIEIPLGNADLSNTASILSFSISRAMAPHGCSFYLDDIALRGPKDD